MHGVSFLTLSPPALRPPRVVRAVRRLDARLLTALHARGDDPRAAAAARALSRAGEHGALWLAAGLAAAAVDRSRRPAWLRGTALTAAAHLAGVGAKHLVRRPRPTAVRARVAVLGPHSFPSAHAASSAAAAVAAAALLPAAGALAVPAAAAMCLSRVVAGVHHPSDVAAGALLGAAAAGLGMRGPRGRRRG
ncbi:phosphatase PAP2 family protein [Streptomyces sp. MJP52]|uniref:phosphatase PAP2 family protein n=1 Tax=Streptomyces sp. MJP52 TaxID=2940555 RepID=UPI002476E988|nr:phosphatase PAP2 family protein [Streptomyces sp. MJP52]MDH6225416.1 membrane-associated phospholipid phosphatase [Streptomyces sp. MJP52]